MTPEQRRTIGNLFADIEDFARSASADAATQPIEDLDAEAERIIDYAEQIIRKLYEEEPE